MHLAGKYYDLQFVSHLYGPDGKAADGLCDPPSGDSKKILIRNSLKRNPQRLLSVIFHELLHAGNWNIAEENVEECAEEAARVAIAIGFTYTPKGVKA